MNSATDTFLKVSSNGRKALNFVWLYLKFTPKDAEFRQPIPLETIENIKQAAANNSDVDVRLWVDSKRMSKSQMMYLRRVALSCVPANLEICDLRNIPRYECETLFNQEDRSPHWRANKHSLIWRQVDAARVLACMQGGYDQSFYSDADITNLQINSDEIQSVIARHGVISSGGIDSKFGHGWFENQMFGFTPQMRSFFGRLYCDAVTTAHKDYKNGFSAYIDLFNKELVDRLGIKPKDIVFKVSFDGQQAMHPDDKVDPQDFRLHGGSSDTDSSSYPERLEEYFEEIAWDENTLYPQKIIVPMALGPLKNII